MNITDLYYKINSELEDTLNGELIINNNTILWTYTLNGSESGFEYSDETEEVYFESPEELLLETYQKTLEDIERILDDIGEIDNWNISEFNINYINVNISLTIS